MEWTDRQLEAIGSRGSDILVAAAAGSGKTAVLTERIKTLVVDERVDIGKLLVVTFTEAAAGEMKQRITASLEEAGAQIGAGMPGADAANFISDQLRRTGAAAVSTFHSFALSIIKEHCYEIGLAPPEGICDEQQSFFMKEKALDSLLAEKFDEGDEGFIAFLNNYSAPSSERNIREMILEVYERIMSYPSPFAWLDEAVEKLALGLDDEMFMDVLGGEIAYKLESAERLMAAAAEILSDAGCPSV
jgi:ATP-dependent helicase/nuclease subunit A